MSEITTTAAAPAKFERRILYLFTRTPLHVGAGASVGAIDQPIQRERHTGFPIIPGSTLKGVFADEWTEVVEVEQDIADKPGQKIVVRQAKPAHDRDWLFGAGNDTGFSAGALQFSEARLLAFPVRSARGSFAWVTSPLILSRAMRDGALRFTTAQLASLHNGLTDETASFARPDPLAIDDQISLEDYVFGLARASEGTEVERAAANVNADTVLHQLGAEMKALLPADAVWSELVTRLAVVSDGMMSFFATSACEVAQHVRIDDATGTAAKGGLFNQENVPAETLFYFVAHAYSERGNQLSDSMTGQPRAARTAAAAKNTFLEKVAERRVFQFGADASTGLGYCSVQPQTEAAP